MKLTRLLLVAAVASTLQAAADEAKTAQPVRTILDGGVAVSTWIIDKGQPPATMMVPADQVP